MVMKRSKGGTTSHLRLQTTNFAIETEDTTTVIAGMMTDTMTLVADMTTGIDALTLTLTTAHHMMIVTGATMLEDGTAAKLLRHPRKAPPETFLEAGKASVA